MLGADTRIVRAAVAQFYKNQGVTGENAGDYLEKLIQLRFDLPPIQEDVMGDYLHQISGADKADEILEGYWPVLVAGAEINPRKTKTFLNDLNLAWAMLVNTGQAEGVDRADFTRWQVLMRSAPENFRRRVREIEDQDLRLKFVGDALRWARGDEDDETLKATFQDYSSSRRLQRVLRAISAFGEGFDAPTLDAFLHLVAPPAEPAVEPQATFVTPRMDRMVVKTERGVETISLRETQAFGGIEFVPVPEGVFLMGSREDDDLALDREHPQHTVEIPYDYWIGRFPATTEQYLRFVETTKREYPWREEHLEHPAVSISWNDAQEYLHWLNDTYFGELPDGYAFRLPTEAEWEKAARGEYGNVWPWGDEFDPQKCNSSEGVRGGTSPVDAYSPAGDSPYGAADMAGNVWEWTHSLFKDYPYDAADGREDENDSGRRVVRGGSFDNNRRLARAAARNGYYPGDRDVILGLRVAVAPRLS